MTILAAVTWFALTPVAHGASALIDMDGYDEKTRVVAPPAATPPSPVRKAAPPAPATPPPARPSVAKPSPVARSPAPAATRATPSASPDRPPPAPETPRAGPPTRETPARETPPPPTKPAVTKKPARTTCTDDPAEVKAMVEDVLGTNLFKVSWASDAPILDSTVVFKVTQLDHVTHVVMATAEGRTIGSSPACFLVQGEGDRRVIKVGLLASQLQFTTGFARIKESLMKSQLTNDNLPLILSRDTATRINVGIGENGALTKTSFSAH